MGALAHRISRRGLLNALGAFAILAPVRSALAASSAPSGSATNFDDHAGGWLTYVDPPQPDSTAWAALDNVPSPGRKGEALNIGIRGGSPYTGIQGYAQIDNAPDAQAIELKLDWRFSDTTWNNDGGASVVQANELTISKWAGQQRFEWALQWENVSDGTAQAADAPNWRVWTGATWRDLGVSQRLRPNVWHSFRLRGSIVDGQVNYVEFKSNDQTHVMTDVFAAVPTDGPDRMTVALQLDGNYAQDDYDCLFDHVGVRWWDANPW
jgi:hypothetical protein